ncbi:MAG TPA: GntR family transcriptional regulator [Cerasibacillus sp.]|uniref:GntR family transcriptional regulator n=1 Tax=Cerasibacillus sp. TaxID=2498711 RepID=UPI002F3FB661
MSIRSDSRQLYLQVIDKIKDDIAKGKYKENEKLPSEYELSKQLGVSRATLREALRLLEEENVITRKHGVGTFINSKPIFSSGIEQLSSVTDMIIQSGKQPGTLYLATHIVETSDTISHYFPNERMLKIERVRTADAEPVVFCIDQLPEGIIPVEHIAKEESLFQLLEKQTTIRISYAVTYIEPVCYDERIYNILNCRSNQPVLLLKQMHYTGEDKPVLYSQNYFRSDMFSFHVFRKRI